MGNLIPPDLRIQTFIKQRYKLANFLDLNRNLRVEFTLNYVHIFLKN